MDALSFTADQYSTMEYHTENSYSYDFDTFICKFSSELIDITEENLKDVNIVINITGTSEINKRTKKRKQVSLSLEDLQEIHNMAHCLHTLEAKGITNRNYEAKIRKYYEFQYTALQDYGINLFDTIPFSNPSEIRLKIDATLTNAGLNKDQKKMFYSSLGLRTRIPNQQSVEKYMSTAEVDVLQQKIQLRFIDLDIDEQIAITENQTDYKYSDSYYSILKELKIAAIPESIKCNLMSIEQEATAEYKKYSHNKEKEEKLINQSKYMTYPFKKNNTIKDYDSTAL